MIEDVEELDPELGVVSLLEREVLEHGEIDVLEARVAEDVPAHGAEGSSLGRYQYRFAGYVAAALSQRLGVGGHRTALLSQRRRKRGDDAANPGLARATNTDRAIEPTAVASGTRPRVDAMEVHHQIL